MLSAGSFLWLIPTVAALFAITFATVAVAYRDVVAPRWAGLALGALALAAAIDLSRPDTTPLTLWLAGVGHWIAAGCIMQAFLSRFERSLPVAAVAIGAGLLAPLHAWSIVPGDAPDLRVALVNAGGFGLFAMGFLLSRGCVHHRLDRVMRGIIAIVLVLYPIRLAVYHLYPPGAGEGGYVMAQHMLMLFASVGVLGASFVMALLLATGSDIVQSFRGESERDALTGLANRRGLARMQAEDADDHRYGAVLAIDLDHFKFVNDHYGHDVGDKVLVAVAHELQTSMSTFGDVARMGGEEFAVLIDQQSGASASALALVARKAVASVVLPTPNERLRITASVGAAVRAPRQSLNATMKAADLALYQAKAGGRDRAFEAARCDGLLELRSVA